MNNSLMPTLQSPQRCPPTPSYPATNLTGTCPVPFSSFCLAMSKHTEVLFTTTLSILHLLLLLLSPLNLSQRCSVAQPGLTLGRQGHKLGLFTEEEEDREQLNPRRPPAGRSPGLVCQPCARPRRSNNHWPQGMRLSHLGVLCCQKQNQGPAHKRLHSQDSRGVG